jgi:hypothetical protein
VPPESRFGMREFALPVQETDGCPLLLGGRLDVSREPKKIPEQQSTLIFIRDGVNENFEFREGTNKGLHVC